MDLSGTGRRAGVLCLFIVLLATGRPELVHAEDDAAIVYCLSPAQRSAVVDAGVSLGRARPDPSGTAVLDGTRTLTPREWRASRPADFAASCEALYASTHQAAASQFATLLPVLTAVLGAVLAFFAASWRDRVARGRVQAEALRSAHAEFHDAAGQYLRDTSSEHPDTALGESRRKFVARLAETAAAHRRWTVVRHVRDRLTTGEFGGSLTEDWYEQSEATRARRRALLAALDSQRDAVLDVAIALERPLRARWILRGAR
ncbi:hypothetical protein [Amycolatopsis sp. DG1A-15b]|uniref:hypothetical protein n=1 Tax=Amycolatopsis sp. DG1A-15b TaxID=3052846 RepID=UPI00255BE8F0|nr:hypothetical protein [Amycolatopsis sp. DG1A-15b]WIX88191.1 hypothetical protein QRY02_44920 [Amycolatopsis sp. DG1A-15b]